MGDLTLAMATGAPERSIGVGSGRRPRSNRGDDPQADTAGPEGMGGTGVDAIATAAGEPVSIDLTLDSGERPTSLLPISHLLRISAYWLGLTTIDSAVGQFNTNRLEFDHFVTGRARSGPRCS